MRLRSNRWVLGGLVILLVGCYSLQPTGGAVPEVGTTVAFDVNDVGRVALGGAVGPEIGQIEGRLLEKDAASYLLSIKSVRLLRGGEQVWNGEQVRVRMDYLTNSYQKRFSLGRSLAAGVAGLGGFGAFMITRSLLGGGTEDDGGPPDDSVNTRIGRP